MDAVQLSGRSHACGYGAGQLRDDMDRTGSAVALYSENAQAGSGDGGKPGDRAYLCNVILKPLAARPRPFEVNMGVRLLIEAPKDFSFPSGHTGASFAAAAALFFVGSRGWIPAAVLAALIGFSRLYLYVHYPTDVLAGALLGIAAGWAACRLFRNRAKG